MPWVTREVRDVLDDRADGALHLLVSVLGAEAIPASWAAREARRPQWMLLRGYWFVDRRWEQKWIWCTPEQAAPLMRKR